MTTRNELVQAALAVVKCKPLNSEVEHYLSIDDDEQRPYDYYEAIDQAYELALDVGDTVVIKAGRLCLILLGVFIVITEEQIANTVTLGRGGAYDFKLNGKKYVFNEHLQAD